MTDPADGSISGNKKIRKPSPFVLGRRFEDRVMDWLRKQGFYTFRSPNSKGVFDIAAIPPIHSKDPRPWLIQAKKHQYIHPNELERMMEIGSKLAARMFLISKDKEGNLVKREYDVSKE